MNSKSRITIHNYECLHKTMTKSFLISQTDGYTGKSIEGTFLSRNREMCKLEETKQETVFTVLGINKKRQTQEYHQTVKYPQYMFSSFKV